MNSDSNNSVKLFFCGDFCSTPSTSYICVSEDLKDIISSCNIKVCNFEGPVKSLGKPIVKTPPHIQQSADAPLFLESLGFNVISLANNHIMDFGVEGYISTRKAFTKAVVAGAGTFDEVYNVKIFEIKDFKIGILFLTYATVGALDTDYNNCETIGCAYIDHLRTNHLISRSKKEVDFLLIYVHDGIEYFDVPLPEQRARYKDLIDYGADAIIGHHSHTPQGWEIYNGCPIFYSLGNFFFNSKSTPDFKAKSDYWYNGLAVELMLTKEHPILFRVYNTLNDCNRKIVLDNSASSLSHTNGICEILKDDDAYTKKISNMIEGLWSEKYAPALFCGFAYIILRMNVFLFLKSIRKAFKLKDANRVYSFLRNSNHKNIMVRALKSYTITT